MPLALSLEDIKVDQVLLIQLNPDLPEQSARRIALVRRINPHSKWPIWVHFANRDSNLEPHVIKHLDSYRWIDMSNVLATVADNVSELAVSPPPPLEDFYDEFYL